MGIFTPDPYEHLKDPPLWKKDLRRSKQSSTTYVQPFSLFRQGLFTVWRYSIWQVIVNSLSLVSSFKLSLSKHTALTHFPLLSCLCVLCVCVCVRACVCACVCVRVCALSPSSSPSLLPSPISPHRPSIPLCVSPTNAGCCTRAACVSGAVWHREHHLQQRGPGDAGAHGCVPNLLQKLSVPDPALLCAWVLRLASLHTMVGSVASNPLDRKDCHPHPRHG